MASMSSFRHGGKYLLFAALAALPPALGGLAFLAASHYRPQAGIFTLPAHVAYSPVPARPASDIMPLFVPHAEEPPPPEPAPLVGQSSPEPARPTPASTPQAIPLPPSRPAAVAVTEQAADAPIPPRRPDGLERLPALKLQIAAVSQSELSARFARFDAYTAVYDLSAHTVYLPNGAKLEAHSGLGEWRDDARHVDEKDRGPTPPHFYDLTLREEPFHGVQALRLSPEGGPDAIFGREGLLAHTYMLGPNGDSNGCVSFRNYDAFLEAYQAGLVKHLAVVAALR